LEKSFREFDDPISWANFQSSNDYVTRYMYRACTVGEQSIGSSGIKWQAGHAIENFEVSELVKGHTDFMRNLEELCHMTGLQHI
jgi:hypothetical protein